MARVFLLCLFLSFKILQCLSQDCTVGEMYENDCYLLITTEATWQDAKLDCINRNGSLASINNNGTNNFIANLAGGGKLNAWIGATDEETEGEWKWSNGDNFEFTSWAPGQPNNQQGKPVNIYGQTNLNQNCVETNNRPFTSAGSGKWNDDYCKKPKPYICKGRNLVPDHTEPLPACNGQRWWKESLRQHGIEVCRTLAGFTAGDNEAEKEMFIQAYEYNSTCSNTCKTLHPTSTGITESVRQTYDIGNGWNENKCWCEFRTPVLNKENKNYRTCVFEEPPCFPVDEEHLDACTSYTNLTESWRRIDNSTTTKDIHCDNNYDNYLAVPKWYRFTGAAGSKLPEGPSIYERGRGQTGKRNCGSSHLAYINYPPKCEYTKSCHPSLRDGVAYNNICFESAASEGNTYNGCKGNFEVIRVAACKNGDDEYFVYRLYFWHSLHYDSDNRGCSA